MTTPENSLFKALKYHKNYNYLCLKLFYLLFESIYYLYLICPILPYISLYNIYFSVIFLKNVYEMVFIIKNEINTVIISLKLKNRSCLLKFYKEYSDICCICLEDIEDTSILACGHQFHSDCIIEWLNIKMSCPLCKTNFNTEFEIFNLSN
ncbi:hypothetical protein HZS_204 [Henneguya salminicola]|nr:hypothetical protein HZS_204 [Henneguya salminicola]